MKCTHMKQANSNFDLGDSKIKMYKINTRICGIKTNKKFMNQAIKMEFISPLKIATNKRKKR